MIFAKFISEEMSFPFPCGTFQTVITINMKQSGKADNRRKERSIEAFVLSNRTFYNIYIYLF